MSDETALPDFAIAMRGYDRLQVDDYIVKQTVWLEEARARMEAAESELAAVKSEVSVPQERLEPSEHEELETRATRRSLEELGERVERILTVAWETAEEVRQDADRTAAEIVRGAEERMSRADEEVERRARQAEQAAEDAIARKREHVASQVEALIEEAKRESRELVARARVEARQVMKQAEGRRQELGDEVAALDRRRKSALGELGRLRAGLEDLFSSLGDDAEDKDEETLDLREAETRAQDSPADTRATTTSTRRRVL